MKKRLVLSAALAALLAACGSDDSACVTRDAELAAGAVVPGTCTASAGSTVTIPVNLCPKCSDTRASCQAEFIGGQVEIAPIFFECEESRGCAINPSCENNPLTRRVNCTVSVPSGTTPGQYDIVNAGTGGTRVGSLDVTGGAPSCAFGINEL